MTTIAAAWIEGRCAIASDSCITTEGGTSERFGVDKSLTVAPWLVFGCAGGAHMDRWLRTVKVKARPRTAAAAHRAVDALLDGYRKWLRREDAHKDKDLRADGAVIATPWWLATVDDKGFLWRVGEVDGAAMATAGSGGGIALGAMEALRDLIDDPAHLTRAAVEVACRRDAYTAGPIDVRVLPPAPGS